MNKSQKLGLEGGAGGRASVGAMASLVSAPAAAWRWWWCVWGVGMLALSQALFESQTALSPTVFLPCEVPPLSTFYRERWKL